MKKSKILASLLLVGMAVPTLAACAVGVDDISANVPEEMVLGTSKELEVTITPENATNQEYSIASSDTGIVGVEGNTITAKAIGNAEIILKSAEKEAISKTYPVKVVHSYPESITTNIPEKINLTETIEVAVSFNPADVTFKEYEVTSENNDVLVYSKEENKLKPVAVGTSKVTVSVPGCEAKAEINVEVTHLMPTDFSVEVPSEITTLDEIALDVKLTPENATFNTYTVTSSDEKVLVYNPIEKVITPLGPGEADITVAIKEANLSKTFHVVVKQGYTAPKTFEEFKNFVKAQEDVWNANASHVDYSKIYETHYSEVETTTTTQEYKVAEDGYSYNLSEVESSDPEVVKEEKAYNAIKDNKLYLLTSSFSNYHKSSDIFDIVEEDKITDSNKQITLEKARKELAVTFVDDFVGTVNDYNLGGSITADGFKTSALENGHFVVDIKSQNLGDWSCQSYDITAEFDKLGNLLTAKAIKGNYDGKTETNELGKVSSITTYEYALQYNEKYAVKDLDNGNVADYFATSFDVVYEGYNREPNTLFVGDYFSNYSFEVSNIVPATAANMKDLNIEIVSDANNALDTSGYSPKVVNEGEIVVRVSGKNQIAEPVVREVTLTAQFPAPTSISSARVDLRSNYLIIGETSTLSASVGPYNAKQDYEVTSSDPTKGSVAKNAEGVWELKALAVTEENKPLVLTFNPVGYKDITTSVEIKILAEKPAEKPGAVAGTYNGKATFTMAFGNGEYPLTLNLSEDGTGTMYKDGNTLVYNITYTYDEASGTITAECKDPSWTYDNETFTWTHDKVNNTITGKITMEYGAYEHFFSVSR